MTLRCKKPRPLTRQERFDKDARLFIIATEDSHVPKQYFELFKNPNSKVVTLPTEGGFSAPQHVLQRLNAFLDEYRLMDEDEFWLVLDTDHWIESNHIHNFTKVCTEAVQKEYQLAHSNPCFDIWILLHFTEIDGMEDISSCKEVVAKLKEYLGEYSKRSINQDEFPESAINDAIRRAEKIDTNPDDRWPQLIGTHVYKIAKKLLS